MTAPRSTRLLTVLNSLAERHVPSMSVRGSSDDRIAALASNGVLVIPLRVPDAYHGQQTALIAELVSVYGSLYRLLTDTLFPSLKAISANYADAESPPIIVFEAAGLPVTAALAHHVVPFVAGRVPGQPVSLAELQGVVHFMLDDLEAQDVPPAVQRDLVRRGSEYITRLLGLPLEQRALLPPRRQYVYLAPPPPEQPISSTPPPPPESVRPSAAPAPAPPEAPRPAAIPRFQSSIPIFFDMDDDSGQDNLPPVLPPPR